MFKNKRFKEHAVVFLVVGFIYMFFYAGLMNDHLNALTPFLMSQGWSEMNITNPVTAGAMLTTILYLFIGAAFVKFGVKKILVPSIIIAALAAAGLANGIDNYNLYFISLLLLRALVVPLQMGGFMLAANWFIKYRGRVLGIITAGSPLFSIAGIGILIALIEANGLKAYYVIAIVLLITAILTALWIKDTPEELDLHPDGADHAPVSEKHEFEPIKVKKLLSELKAWQLIISYGILQFVITAAMAFMAVRYNQIGGSPEFFEQKVVFPWLMIGAAAGIPMSYVLGWIDDKLGSIKASLVLNVLYLFAIIPLAIMPEGGSIPLMLMWSFGVACMTGGIPTMHPSITSYVYGRKRYMAANKWIMTIQAVLMAGAIPFMASFSAAGNLELTYYIMLGMLAISFITIVTMKNIPDANLEDRDYGQSM